MQFCNNTSGQLASVHNFGVAAILGGKPNFLNTFKHINESFSITEIFS
jgi:hypothetical protein